MLYQLLLDVMEGELCIRDGWSPPISHALGRTSASFPTQGSYRVSVKLVGTHEGVQLHLSTFEFISVLVGSKCGASCDMVLLMR